MLPKAPCTKLLNVGVPIIMRHVFVEFLIFNFFWIINCLGINLLPLKVRCL